MITSIPHVQVPLSETALYQMCCDLSDLLGAGWEMRIEPDIAGDPFGALVTFRRAAPKEGDPNIPFGADAVRFSLATDLPTIIKDFHQRVFPISPLGNLSPIGDVPPKPE